MTNQELIVKLKEYISWLEQGCETELEIVEHIKMAIKALQKQQWIPCSKRMPEEPYGCLVTIHWEDPYSGEYDQIYTETVGWDGEGWNDSDGYTLPYDVIAWMPLPEPYTEE